jgi:tRNA pseudouridine38-40 synthase
MVNIKMIIEYDGSNYCGWQVQPNGMSVQQMIEESLFELTGERIRIHGSGRTDAGVHATGQTANFKTSSKIPPEAFSKALNHKLPDDISIVSSSEVPEEFHARFSAKGKRYRYVIFTRDSRSPFHENRSYRTMKKPDVAKMASAAVHFKGTHDFKGFMSSGSKVEDTVRTISDISVEEKEDVIEIRVFGNGFLYNMVRIIAGTLLECGYGKLDPEEIPYIINSGKRENAGPTLPSYGLFLDEVVY